jgi:hypothetical protein
VTEAARAKWPTRALAFSVLAWLLPSAGHWALGKRGRALVFLIVIGTCLGVGWGLDGNLYRPVAGQPLTLLGTVGAMGMGIPYFALRWFLGYEGSAEAPGYEYGTVFLLSAGLMNLLIVLDAWDIATGRKE